MQPFGPETEVKHLRTQRAIRTNFGHNPSIVLSDVHYQRKKHTDLTDIT